MIYRRSEKAQDLPEHQMFPRGSLLIMSTGILMGFSSVFVIVFISYMLKLLLPEQNTAIVTVALIPLLAIGVVTPGFMIPRGRPRWQKVVEVINGMIMAILATAIITLWWAGDTGFALACSIGLILAVGARACYRSSRYLDGMEYYRAIWAHHRQKP